MMSSLWLTKHQQTDVDIQASKLSSTTNIERIINKMKGFPPLPKMVKELENQKGSPVFKLIRINIFCACISLLLGGCRASPLYIGQFGKQAIATAPGAVLRNGLGEPIMADLPPLGALPAAEIRHAQLSSSPPHQSANQPD
jgi:hypothetical protein